MNTTTLLENILKAVHDDAALDAWCQSNFGTAVKVFDTLNEENLPVPPDPEASEVGDYPFVAADVDDKSGGTGEDGEEVNLHICCALVDASASVAVDGHDNYKQAPGARKRREMWRLVLGAMANAELDGGYIQSWGMANNPVTEFPEFAASMAVQIVREYVFRDNRME